MDFLINFLRLTRPLSNVKNIVLVLLALYFSGQEFDFIRFILGIFSLSFICSAIYAYNALCDLKFDEQNKNKQHYSQAVYYFGDKYVLAIALILAVLGFSLGFYFNFYFLISLLTLLIIGFLYSSKYTRFKEKFILDILFGASFTFFARFMASWFIFSVSLPPLLPLVFLVSVKSGGYLLYKELDYPYLIKTNIKNSITILRKKTKIIISILLWIVSFFSFVFLCFNYKYFKVNILGYLPIRFLFLLLFAIPPLLLVYLSVLGKIKTKIKDLRTLGFIYWILVIIMAISLL